MFQIKNQIISDDSPTFIIAEAGVNHNGNIELAKKLVDAAVSAGANAIKFQTFKAENLVTRDARKANYQQQTTNAQETQSEMLKRLEFDYEQHLEIVNYCNQVDIIFLSTPFDFESVELLEQLNIPAYKISSGDVTNLPFLKYITEKNKPIILSTGIASLGEVEEAVDTIQTSGKTQAVLLHCTSSYPTNYQDVNLRAMQTLKVAFKLPVGYSDHTLGIEVPIAAVALGACVIEKHFTLDRNFPGPDHLTSLEPDELKAMVRAIRNVEVALGDGLKRCQIAELNSKEVARKSIVALRDITKGEVLTKDVLGFKRPGTGLPPKFVDFLVGKKIKKDILRDSIIRLGDVE